MKNSYILLRNNKESNSLSIEDLQVIGLKKTDLIWVECQSMDWRSPSEIAELKGLVSTSNSNDTKNNSEKLVLKQVPESINLVKKQKTGEIWVKPEEKKSEKYNYPERVIISGLEKKKIDSLLSDGHSPWGEIKENQVANPKQKVQSANKFFTFQLFTRFKKIALYTALILTGALLMLLIQDLGNKKPVAFQQEITQPEKASSLPVATPKGLNMDSAITASNEVTGIIDENSPVSPKKEQKKTAKFLQNTPPQTEITSNIPDTSNNKEKKNTQPVTELNSKPVSIEDISPKISLSANDYKVGFFGGIRDLTLTLKNNSKYLLDKVNIEIKYLNQNGKVITTEEGFFQNVKAGDTQDLHVNKSKRGVKAEYQITSIECKAITDHK